MFNKIINVCIYIVFVLQLCIDILIKIYTHVSKEMFIYIFEYVKEKVRKEKEFWEIKESVEVNFTI